MLKSPPPLDCPSFEGVNVGRGKGVPTVWAGDIYKEGNLVTTVGLTVWHINEYRHFELPAANHGHFHSGKQLGSLCCSRTKLPYESGYTKANEQLF